MREIHNVVFLKAKCRLKDTTAFGVDSPNATSGLPVVKRNLQIQVFVFASPDSASGHGSGLLSSRPVAIGVRQLPKMRLGSEGREPLFC